MSCTNSCAQTSCTTTKNHGCGFVTIIVLYILLAIILSAFVC